jgi:hypothetical protein
VVVHLPFLRSGGSASLRTPRDGESDDEDRGADTDDAHESLADYTQEDDLTVALNKEMARFDVYTAVLKKLMLTVANSDGGNFL